VHVAIADGFVGYGVGLYTPNCRNPDQSGTREVDSVKIVREFDYRNAAAIISGVQSKVLPQVREILTSTVSNLNLASEGKARSLSSQVQGWFVAAGWKQEVPAKAVPGMRYDLHNGDIPIEIELGHERLVYPDFFEFMADFSQMHIPAAIMIVTGTPTLFGHSWHCSIASTERKIMAIRGVYLVPTLVIGVDP
jgi:hypothetical protein